MGSTISLTTENAEIAEKHGFNIYCPTLTG